MCGENGCEGSVQSIIRSKFWNCLFYWSGKFYICQEKVGEFQEPLPVATVIYMVLITQTFDSNKRKWLLIYPLFPLTPDTQGSWCSLKSLKLTCLQRLMINILLFSSVKRINGLERIFELETLNLDFWRIVEGRLFYLSEQMHCVEVLHLIA